LFYWLQGYGHLFYQSWSMHQQNHQKRKNCSVGDMFSDSNTLKLL
jgi:hypothetical protein